MMKIYFLLIIFASLNTFECQSNVSRISAFPTKKNNLYTRTPFSNDQLLKVLRLLNKPGIQDHGTEQYFRNRFVSDGIWDFRISVPRFIRLKRGIDFGLNRGYSGSKVIWKFDKYISLISKDEECCQVQVQTKPTWTKR